MVQVDVIWAYAFGASFAAASARELRKEEKPLKNDTFNSLMMFLSILFAPSGIYLLVAHPSWETMQLAKSLTDLPAWLVTLFAVTNITQGILGYYVGYKLARNGNYYGAHANWMVAWVLFWFVLICGWDTTGWQRFLYDRSMFQGEAWTAGMHMGPAFLLSHVFGNLLAMAAIFAPVLWVNIAAKNYASVRKDTSIPRNKKPSVLIVGMFSLGTMFVTCLAIALGAALVVMGMAHVTGSVLAGYLLGLPICGLIGYYGIFPRGGVMYKIAQKLFVVEPEPAESKQQPTSDLSNRQEHKLPISA